MKIFFSVGEPSGDLHGGNLIQELLSNDDSIECVGFGGPKMESAGLQSHGDLTRLAVMFFWQVITKIPHFYRLYKAANKYFSANKVDAVVLIDYPGFNWWIAKAAKRHGITVFYYGVPQMWAWAPWRIRKLKKRVDHVICKLPFEKTWFEKRDCQAHFVGHPYIDELSNRKLDEQFTSDFDDPETRLLTLLPGSRDQEVQGNLDWMLEAANDVCSKVDDVSVAIACYNQSQYETVLEQVRANDLPFDVMYDRTPELIHMADVCIACSGSVSLELMYHRKPTAIVYRLSPVQWTLKKIFLRVPYITLVNLLWLDDLGKDKSKVPPPHSRRIPFPEFARVNNPSSEIAKHVCRWLNRSDAMKCTLERIDEAASQFEQLGATEKAATTILEILGQPIAAADSQTSETIESSNTPVRRAA